RPRVSKTTSPDLRSIFTNRRDIAETDQHIAIRQFGDGVPVSPLRALVLDQRDGRFGWIRMFPGAPFPAPLAVFGHFHKIVGPDLAVHFGAWSPALNLASNTMRQFGGAQPQHVAVFELAPVVMMVRFANLPKNPAVPICLQRHSPSKGARP